MKNLSGRYSFKTLDGPFKPGPDSNPRMVAVRSPLGEELVQADDCEDRTAVIPRPQLNELRLKAERAGDRHTRPTVKCMPAVKLDPVVVINDLDEDWGTWDSGSSYSAADTELDVEPPDEPIFGEL